MVEYEIFPATSSNAITKEYYMFLVDQINRGTCSKKVEQILHQNGNYKYFTYHLVSSY